MIFTLPNVTGVRSSWSRFWSAADTCFMVTCSAIAIVGGHVAFGIWAFVVVRYLFSLVF